MIRNLHFKIGKLIGLLAVAKSLPSALKNAYANDLGPKEYLVIVKRLNESRYWEKHAKQQICGCFKVGDSYTSYMMDCEYHGLESIFEGKDG